MDVQLFKGDDIETKFDAAFSSVLNGLSTQLDSFFNDAFSCFVLGEVLYDSGRMPLANAIRRDIFRSAFMSIIQSFEASGTFESYLTVFRTIFGNDVTITFTVPAPGQLNVSILAVDSDVFELLARTVDGSVYVTDKLVTYNAGEYISAQILRGFQTQYEVEQMLFEMVPAGIYTVITLSVS